MLQFPSHHLLRLVVVPLAIHVMMSLFEVSKELANERERESRRY